MRIDFTLAELNRFYILACDIHNDYLNEKFREKIYIISGEDFGSEVGSIMIVNMDLYGLKSLGAKFRAKLAKVLYDMNKRILREDPDVWMRPAVKGYGFKYYEYVLCYVDDILCILHVPLKKIDGINAVFKLKWDKAEPPEIYLGAVLQNVTN